MKGSIEARKRLWAIYQELGYIPWKKPRKARKPRKRDRRRGGVYMGTFESIPFMNDDAKRTFTHLLLRPGYMMRDYILRGQHERYLAPFTALLVFYSVFTLLVAIVQPRMTPTTSGSDFTRGVDVSFSTDSTDKYEHAELVFNAIMNTVHEAFTLTQLDLHPNAVDTPWKASLAAVEGDLRSKGIPLFLGSFLMLWLALSILLRKYGISGSGAAAASAYVLCQFCIFMFLALIFSFGKDSKLGLLLMAILLFFDYRQLLGISGKKALGLTIKSGLLYLAVLVLIIITVAVGLYLYAIFSVGPAPA